MHIDSKKFGKVAVLLGGMSAEREVSLMSGNAVVAALKSQNIDAHPIDVGRDIYSVLDAGKFDRAFIALHGPGGEDGVIQGVLETLGIPYTGSQVCASALAMDKQRSKWIWQGLNLATLPFVVLDENTQAEAILQQFNLPWAVKPIAQGSTLGVSKVSKIEQFQQAVALAYSFDNRVMVEPWIEGKELTVGILNDTALPVIYIEAPQGFYDYEAKYFSEVTQYHCPSGLSAEEETSVQKMALEAYRALGCRHWGRVDLMQDSSGQAWILEVNTIPGLTDHSLVPKAAKQIGINFTELTIRILAQTLQR